MGDQCFSHHIRQVNPPPSSYKVTNHTNGICIRYRAGESFLNNFGSSWLTHLQIRSAWDPVLQDCFVLNTEKSKPSIIATLITDIVLLLIVLIGLLRLLRDSGGSFALGRLLWKQVGSKQSHFAVFRFI
jgi:hypothetical protein